MAEKLHSGFHHKILREWQSMNTDITPSNLIYPIFITYVLIAWFENPNCVANVSICSIIGGCQPEVECNLYFVYFYKGR